MGKKNKNFLILESTPCCSKEEYEALKITYDAAVTALADKQDEITAKDNEITAKKAEIAEVEGQHTQKSAELAEKSDLLSQATAQRALKQAELANLEAVLQQFFNQQTTANTAITAAIAQYPYGVPEGIMGPLQATLNFAISNAAATQNLIKLAKVEFESAKISEAHWQQEVKEITQALKELEAKLITLNSELTNLQNQLTALQNQLPALQKAVDEADAALHECLDRLCM